MRVIKDRGVVPPGGRVRFKDPDDGATFAHPYYSQVKLWAHKHRVDSGLPMPLDFDGWFDEQVCKSTPTACIEVSDASEETSPSFFDMAKSFARSTKQWAREGFPITPYPEFKRRSVICAGDETTPRCQFFKTWSAFGISRCASCGCGLGVKLRWATEKCPKGKW